MDWLRGKRTIIGSLAAGVLTVLYSLNVIDEQLAGVLAGLIVTWTGVSMRLAVKHDS